MSYFQALAGFLFFLFTAWFFSSNRKNINWKLVLSGLCLQLFLSLLLTKVPFFVDIFMFLSRCFVKLLDFSLYGAVFLFGDLAKNSGAFSDVKHNLGFIFAFQVLPTIVFFSTFTSGLYYLGILQKVVFAMAWLMSKTMKISGAESLSAAGNIFLGQTEAPLLVKPFISNMTRSEMLCLMTGGMATIAGGVMAAYIAFLGGDSVEGRITFAAHLLTASIMNAPAGIVFAKILLPETEKINTQLKLNKEKFGTNLIDALSNGASEGVKLAANVGGMLLAFIAVVAFVNFIFQKTGFWLGINSWIAESTSGKFDALSMQYILGQIYRPVAWFMGVPWNESLQVGSLLGQKTVINEFVSYIELTELKNKNLLSSHTIVICTFALCGFSNFSSIAIQLGGISIMAPTRKSVISELGFRALLAASLACFSSGIWAGILL
jgi:CNT family concentrative nucleoside transporter